MISDEKLDSLLGLLPMVPVSDRLQSMLDDLVAKVEKGELYQKDAEPGSQGQQAKEG